MIKVDTFKDKATFEIGGETVQMINLDDDFNEDSRQQLELAVNCCGSDGFRGIIKHMALNGYSVELEDIY